ncbi:hypothetical protein CDAR_524881 [Caerostris darwini]|uniref:Secreted protein n=1 Tax=Caerostris darwini TaxID=1538125 RepID=A0AAV4QX99_9ARAC|nr:hypothetical protein CDAR_524881 [Caerostris darwini]
MLLRKWVFPSSFFAPLQKERAGAKVFGTVPINGGGGCPLPPPLPADRGVVVWFPGARGAIARESSVLFRSHLTACVDKPGRRGGVCLFLCEMEIACTGTIGKRSM